MPATAANMAPLCGVALGGPDRKAWREAIALLVGLKLRHGLDEQELAAAVGKALRKSRDHRTCEDCRVKACSLGLPSEGHKRRWCAGCAKAHPGAVNVDIRKCEDCRLKQPNFGMPSDGRKRWCGGCARVHAGAVNVTLARQKCETCGLKTPHHGLAAEGRKRWCSGCARAHAGAVAIGDRKCQGCGIKSPSFGLPPSDGGRATKRWCGGCAQAHAGAVNLTVRQCEACGPPSPRPLITVLIRRVVWGVKT
jgi:hypothetical protein